MIAIAVLVLAAALFMVGKPVSVESLIEWGSAMSAHPAVAVGLVALQAVLLALALPGTLMLWVVAPLYTPFQAALILTAGSVLGASGAYGISRHIRGDRLFRGFSGRVIGLLRRRNDLFIQLLLRIVPGFPHSVINYGAGMLKLPLSTFLVATTLGLAVKWFVYASAMHAMLEMGSGEGKIGIDSLIPLFILAILFAVGWLVHQRVKTRRSPYPEHDA